MSRTASYVDAYIGIGSNLDDPERQVLAAAEQLSTLPDSRLRAVSSLYRSKPLAGMQQPDYVNAVARIGTALSARALLQALQSIEQRQGRVRTKERWSPRVIDLDILLLGDDQIAEPGLKVPHPGIATRNFVLLPLLEIASDVTAPGLGALKDLPIDRGDPPIERLRRETVA